MESMKHHLMNFVFTIILSTKLPLYLNKMALQNAKTKLLKETMNFVLINLRAPHKLQGEAVLISNYTINKVLRKKIKKKYHMSYENVKNFPINTSRCGGCLVKIVVFDPKKVKI